MWVDWMDTYLKIRKCLSSAGVTERFWAWIIAIRPPERLNQLLPLADGGAVAAPQIIEGPMHHFETTEFAAALVQKTDPASQILCFVVS